RRRGPGWPGGHKPPGRRVRERRVPTGAREGARAACARGGAVSVEPRSLTPAHGSAWMGGMLAFLDEGTWLRDVGLPILLTVVAAIVATVILRVVVGRFKRKLEQAPHLSEAGNLQRAATLAHALSATFVVVVWVVAGMLILNYLEVPLAPFIASAGSVGVALGFGAQSIVKDTLTGFFILLENQFGVGDIVEIRSPRTPILGRVEWLTLRATALRAYDGGRHLGPNGNIVLVSNKSRGGARAIVDTPLAD